MSYHSGEKDGITKRIVLGKIDISKKTEAIKYFNEQIRDELNENAIVITKDGNVIRFVGNKSGVGLWNFEIEESIITHNHPVSNGIVSFGSDDFYLLRDNQTIAQLCCVNRDFTYTIEPIKDFSKVTYNELYKAGLEYYSEEDFEIQDRAMRVLADRGYVKYDKRRIN